MSAEGNVKLILLVRTTLTTPRPRLPRTRKNLVQVPASRQVEIRTPTSELLKPVSRMTPAFPPAQGSVLSTARKLPTSRLSPGWAALQAIFRPNPQGCTACRVVPRMAEE